MRKVLLLLMVLHVAILSHAQEDIFKKHGYHKEPLTLSKGKYKETFYNEDVMQVGTVLIDTRTDKVVQFLEIDTAKYAYRAEITSRFLTIDPMAEEYYNWSPYVYVGNNPIIRTDPTGKTYTDYRNEKGEKLYKTNDGLTEIIIVPDKNVSKLESKLNELDNKGKINDAKANKEELHKLGTEILDYDNKHDTGNTNLDNGFVMGYSNGYEGKEESFLTKAMTFITGALGEEGAQIQAGKYNGQKVGKADKESGKINVFKPFDGLKNNTPLIKLKNNKK